MPALNATEQPDLQGPLLPFRIHPPHPHPPATGELMTKENTGSFRLDYSWMRMHHPRACPYSFILNTGPGLAWLCARIPKWPSIRLLPQPVFPPVHSLPPFPPSAGLASSSTLFTFLDVSLMAQQHGHSPLHTRWSLSSVSPMVLLG